MTSDAALVLRARGGDELAFQRLAERFRPFIRHLAGVKYHLKGGEADDLRQEGMIGLHKAVVNYRSVRNDSFRAFAQLVIERQVITAIKKANLPKRKPLNEAVSLAKPMYGGADHEDAAFGELLPDRKSADPASLLEHRETLTILRNTIAVGLSDLEAAAVIGIAEGRSYEEIAEQMSTDTKAVDNAQVRAKRKFGEVLAAA